MLTYTCYYTEDIKQQMHLEEKQEMVPISVGPGWKLALSLTRRSHRAKEVIICIQFASHPSPTTTAFLQAWGEATQQNMQIIPSFPETHSQDTESKQSAWNLNDFLVNPSHKSLFVAGC